MAGRAIVIPFRASGDRRRLLDAVERYLRRHHPDIPVIVADDDISLPFSLAASRNQGVLDAMDSGFTSVAVLDADTIVDPKALIAAFELVEWEPEIGVVTPYADYYALDWDATDVVLEDRWGPLVKPSDLAGHSGATHVGIAISGCYVVDCDTWCGLGGQDPRFVGWGPEDYAFLEQHKALLGRPFAKLGFGAAAAMRHDRSEIDRSLSESEQYRRNVDLYGRYINAGLKGYDAMDALVCEHLERKDE